MAYVATDAAAYERSMGRWSRALAAPFLAACGLAPGARVLDAGCGTGALAEAVLAADPAARVTGVDIAEPFLAAARARVPQARFRHGDLAALAEPDGGFDAALSLLVLAFVPDAVAALREMRRVTRPGGLVAAAMWDFTGGFPFLRLLADTAAALSPAGEAFRARHWADPIGAPGRLAAALADAGLVDIAERDLVIRQEFAAFEDWFGPWRGGQGFVGAFLTALPAAEAGALEAAARRAYRAGGPDGPRSFAAVARLATGRVPAPPCPA